MAPPPASMILTGLKIVTTIGILPPAGRRDPSGRQVRQTCLTQSGRSAPPVTPGEAELSVQVTTDLQAAPAARQFASYSLAGSPGGLETLPAAGLAAGRVPPELEIAGGIWPFQS